MKSISFQTLTALAALTFSATLGAANALTGNFGNTRFSATIFTGIVAPNSRAVPGQSTVEGLVEEIAGPTGVPEPFTLGQMGVSLCSIALLRSKSR